MDTAAQLCLQWMPYDPAASADIEAAFQRDAKGCIDVPGRPQNGIDFAEMVQFVKANRNQRRGIYRATDISIVEQFWHNPMIRKDLPNPIRKPTQRPSPPPIQAHLPTQRPSPPPIRARI
eukprot:SAG31_NODE_23073_length_512_cov_0.627119_1_plen_119_part_10